MIALLIDKDMPLCCSGCDFGKRLTNFHTMCEIKPLEKASEDGEKRPKFCPLKEVDNDSMLLR